MTNNGIYTVGLDQHWWYFTYFLRIFLWSSWYLAREIDSNEMRKLIEILPNALALGCQKVFKRCIGTEFCGNWRNFKKKRVKIDEKTCFFVVFMKNIYEKYNRHTDRDKNTTLFKIKKLNRGWPSKHCKLMTRSLWNAQNEGIWMISCTLRNTFYQWRELVFSWKNTENTQNPFFLSLFRHVWQKRTYR